MVRYPWINIREACAISKALPRTFGAFIESKQEIRFNNAMSSTPSSLFHRVLKLHSTRVYSNFQPWLRERLNNTCIMPPQKPFAKISSIITLKELGFVTASSSLSEWSVELKSNHEEARFVSWKLVYRASLFGFKASKFHQACDGEGKYVIVVKSEDGRITVAYNEDGFSNQGTECHKNTLSCSNLGWSYQTDPREKCRRFKVAMLGGGGEEESI
jgi:hypothetical protein